MLRSNLYILNAYELICFVPATFYSRPLGHKKEQKKLYPYATFYSRSVGQQKVQMKYIHIICFVYRTTFMLKRNKQRVADIVLFSLLCNSLYYGFSDTTVSLK
jgi:hypothetical protein